MSEDMMAATAVESAPSNEPTSAPESTAAQQTTAFFEDVQMVDDYGNPLTDWVDPVKPSDDDTKSGNTPEIQGEQGAPKQPENNGEAPENKVDLSEFLSYQYTPARSQAQVIEKPSQQIENAPKQVEATPPVQAQNDWQTELRVYEDNLRANALAPLQKAYSALQKAGGDDSELRAIEAEYREKEALIVRMVDERKVEHIREEERSRFRAMEQEHIDRQEAIASENVISKVAEKIGGKQAFQKLVIGEMTPEGYKPGAAADVIEFLFDAANPNANKETYARDLGKWWNKFTANEGNTRMILRIAAAIHGVNNVGGFVQQARQAAQSEVAQSRAATLKPPSQMVAQRPSTTEKDPLASWMYKG